MEMLELDDAVESGAISINAAATVVSRHIVEQLAAVDAAKKELRHAARLVHPAKVFVGPMSINRLRV